MRRLASQNIVLILAVSGLLLIVVGQTFSAEVLKVHVDDLLAKLGGTLLVVGCIEWFFEARFKHHLLSEIVDKAVGTSNVSRAGFTDFYPESKKVDHTSLFQGAEKLFISLNYDSRLIEDHLKALKDRYARQKMTVLLLINPDGPAATYIRSKKVEEGHIKSNLAKLKRLIADHLGPETEWFKILSHDHVLRYSFVASESQIWIRSYRNSTGFSHVPAFRVDRGGGLFDFYDEDIRGLLKEVGYDAV